MYQTKQAVINFCREFSRRVVKFSSLVEDHSVQKFCSFLFLFGKFDLFKCAVDKVNQSTNRYLSMPGTFHLSGDLSYFFYLQSNQRELTLRFGKVS